MARNEDELTIAANKLKQQYGINVTALVKDLFKQEEAFEFAKDGFDALMRGDDKVVSGFKNKMQVAMSNVTPDAAAADMIKKQQEPVGIEER